MKKIYSLARRTLAAWVRASVPVVAANFAALGLTEADSDEYTLLSGKYDARLADAEAARAAYRAAIDAQDEARKALLAKMAQMWTKVRAEPSVSSALILEAGFSPADQHRSVIRPEMIRDLVAQPFADGSVLLTWNRAGNYKTTAFLIETISPGGTEWKYVSQTTRTRIRLMGFPPGEAKLLRVTALHGKLLSQPSAPVEIYTPAPSASQFFKAA